VSWTKAGHLKYGQTIGIMTMHSMSYVIEEHIKQVSTKAPHALDVAIGSLPISFC
jgi:hypothetical protein